jgi:hypothetical protein
MEFRKRTMPTMFRHVKWLKSALTTDKTDLRFHVNHIYVDKNHRAVATDGMRMHVVDQLLIEAGYYKVVKNQAYNIEIEMVGATKIPDFPYPDTNNLIVMTGVGDVFMDGRHGYRHVSHTNLTRLMKDNGINYNFFVDAVANFSEDYVIRFEEDCNHPFYLYNTADGLMAIIMPFRI